MQQPPKAFDDAKLDSMTEPLTVRVERIKQGHRTPIPMPDPEDGGIPGTGMTKDNIRTLEQFLVTSWVGGGLYEITVTDSSQPNPISMKWNPHWDLKQYPELVPPPLASAVVDNTNNNVIALPSAPFTPFNRSQMPPAYPNGFPQVQTQPNYQQQQPYYPPMPPAPQFGSPAWNAYSGEVERRKQDEELRILREESAKREREAIDARHKSELERVRMEAQQKAESSQREFERRFAELQATIERNSRPSVDPAIEALKEQNRQLAEKAEREAAQRDMDRRDQQMRDLIKTMTDESNRRMEQMMQMFQSSSQQQQTMITQLLQAANNKPDAMAQLQPFVTLMQEQSRSNADAIKEVARQQADGLNKMQAFMMNPRDMVALARESQATSDQASERMQRSFDRVFEIQSKAVENVLQMNQGGSQTAEIVGMGIEKSLALAERWVGGKTANDKFQLEAQRSVAESQARAVEANAAVELARSGAIVTPPPAPQGQLSGPHVQQAQPQAVMPEIPKVPAIGKSKAANANDTSSVKRLGRTDLEWFGPALIDNVKNTREGVAYFHESAKIGRFDKLKRDADGHPMPKGYSAPEVVEGLVHAIIMVENTRQQIPGVELPPIITHVLYQERFADFVDLLLPDASEKFRVDVVQGLIAAIEKLTNQTAQPKPATVAEVTDAQPQADGEDDGDDDDDADDDEDDGEDEDPDNDGKPVKPAKKERAQA